MLLAISVLRLVSGVPTRFTSDTKLEVGRSRIASVTVGDVMMFGGGEGNGEYPYSALVDIYDAGADEWTRGSLTQARAGAFATSVGDLALFAGGMYEGETGALVYSDVVDLADVTDPSFIIWDVSKLSVARAYGTAAKIGLTVIFAGGSNGEFVDTVDIYDAWTGG